MRILIDITHPAHLHFFRNPIEKLREKGHLVKLTGRDKDILVELAEQYGFDIEVFGRFRPGMTNLVQELLTRWRHLYRIVHAWKPEKMMAIAGTYISLIGWLTKVPTHIFYDTEHAFFSNLLAYPFATCVHVPNCYKKKIHWRHRRYAGYHELAYLHPEYFTPDSSVLGELGVSTGQKYVLIRFVGWGAAHDVGHKGISLQMKRKAIAEFSKYASVFITSEAPLPPDLNQYRFPLQSSRVHDALAFASLLYGESATMASEAAVLGTPAIYLDDTGRGYTDEQEKRYRCIFNFSESFRDQSLSIEKGIEILQKRDCKQLWGKKRDMLLKDTIDVTRYVVNIASQF